MISQKCLQLEGCSQDEVITQKQGQGLQPRLHLLIGHGKNNKIKAKKSRLEKIEWTLPIILNKAMVIQVDTGDKRCVPEKG